ncbi:DNA helicase, partial [Tilletia horrida]
TGKSSVLVEIAFRLRKRYEKEGLASVAVTAWTGQTANAIGGSTIHSWLGVSGTEWEVKTPAALAATIHSRPAARARVEGAKSLIIDDLSLMSAAALDKLETVLRLARPAAGTDAAGGLQIVAAADFYGLAPVPSKGEDERDQDGLAFEAACWPKLFERIYLLRHHYRHRDPAFVALLNAVRIGDMDTNVVDELASLDRPIRGEVAPVLLCATRAEVERVHEMRIKAADWDPVVWKAQDSGDAEDESKLDELAPAQFTGVPTASVILTRPLPEPGLVNGTVGQMIAAFTEDKWNRNGFHHFADAPHVYGDGHGWKARMRTMGKRLRKKEENSVQLWPVVRFSYEVDGKEHQYTTMVMHSQWEMPRLPGSTTPPARRRQVPLLLGWAMTIHRAQSMYLPSCSVDVRSISSPGQLYVALSRVSSTDRLQVLGASSLVLSARVPRRPNVDAFEARLTADLKAGRQWSLPAAAAVSADGDAAEVEAELSQLPMTGDLFLASDDNNAEEEEEGEDDALHRPDPAEDGDDAGSEEDPISPTPSTPPKRRPRAASPEPVSPNPRAGTFQSGNLKHGT